MLLAGPEDEWARMRAMPEVVKKWVDRGEAQSTLRPGVVDTSVGHGGAAGYRGLMRSVGKAGGAGTPRSRL